MELGLGPQELDLGPQELDLDLLEPAHPLGVPIRFSERGVSLDLGRLLCRLSGLAFRDQPVDLRLQAAVLEVQLLAPARDDSLFCIEIRRAVQEERRCEAADRFVRADREHIDWILRRNDACEGCAPIVGCEGSVGGRDLGASDGRDEGGRGEPLAGQRDMWKVPLEQGMQFAEVELLDVELVGVGRLLRVGAPIGRGNHQYPPGAQDPLDFREHLLMAIMVLDRLERHHQVDARIRQRNSVCPALHKAQIVPVAVDSLGMLDCLVRDVYADHAARDRCETGAAVAFAAGDVRYVEPARQQFAQRVPMEVLVADLPAHARHETFAGPFQIRSVLRGRRRFVHRSDPRVGERRCVWMRPLRWPGRQGTPDSAWCSS